jgi:RimJ/RimL family protein N-acetyltransferase
VAVLLFFKAAMGKPRGRFIHALPRAGEERRRNMDNMKSLFEGQLVRLGPINHEKDPEIVARWTHDPLLRMVLGGVARPLSMEAAKKMLEKIEKQMDEHRNLFHFMLRAREDDRLVGLAYILLFDLTGVSARLNLGIGDPADRERGYGSDALELLLRYSFSELNLHRVSIFPTADCIPFVTMVEKAGFELEARRRKAAFHDGSYWDEMQMGLLREKWEKQQ